MKPRAGRISIVSLLIVTIVAILLMFFEFNSKKIVKARNYREKIAAAQLTQQSFQSIKKMVDTFNIAIDKINDPNETGLIGIQYSPITIERGNLNAKLTSTNPNIAALVIHLVKMTDLQSGDSVAVALTGSMPALNIAVMCALEILELEPVIITATASSMWGANNPSFTYLDMENVLITKELINHKTSFATLGGVNDNGRGLSPEGRNMLLKAIKRNQIHLLASKGINDAIKKRLEIYHRDGRIKAFINVDEKASPLTGSAVMPGLIHGRSIKGTSGLIPEFSNTNIPVINIIDINSLSEEFRLPIAPIPQPEIGKGRLFYEYRYSVTLAIIFFTIICVILFIILRYDVDYYLRRRKK